MTGGPPAGDAIRVLRPSRLKFALFAAFGLLIGVVGLALALAGEWYGWPILALGAVVCASCLMMLSARFASLTLTPDDFTLRAGFTRRTWRWDAVGDFFSTYIDRSQAVAFTYADRSTLSALKLKVADVRGYDEYLPDTYRMDVDALAALMNEWRQKAPAVR